MGHSFALLVMMWFWGSTPQFRTVEFQSTEDEYALGICENERARLPIWVTSECSVLPGYDQ